MAATFFVENQLSIKIDGQKIIIERVIEIALFSVNFVISLKNFAPRKMHLYSKPEGVYSSRTGDVEINEFITRFHL